MNLELDNRKKAVEKQIKVNIQKNEDGTAKATVTTTTQENGETIVKEEVFEGTLEEVKAQIDAYDKGTTVKVIEKRIVKEIEEEVSE